MTPKLANKAFSAKSTLIMHLERHKEPYNTVWCSSQRGNRQTDTQNDYSNPAAAHAPRINKGVYITHLVWCGVHTLVVCRTHCNKMCTSHLRLRCVTHKKGVRTCIQTSVAHLIWCVVHTNVACRAAISLYGLAGLRDPPGKNVRNRRLSWWASTLVSFRWQQTSNMVFYLLELSQWPCGYSIAGLHMPIELIFVTIKIVARSWFEPSWSFTSTSSSKRCGLYAS